MMKALSKMAALALATAPLAVVAASPLELKSDVFVEKQVKKPDGSIATTLEAPKTILPGDQLVFVVRYRNNGSAPASNFAVTNPIPQAVAFNGTADGTEIVSIDSGKSWGKLAQLRVKMADGTTRPALPGDVTHIKWKMNQTLTAGAGGKLIFRGVVR